MPIRWPKRSLLPPPDPAIEHFPPARDKGNRPLDILTIVGTVSICRRYFWSRATGGLCPVDQPLGVDDNSATCGARCVCCTLGVIHDFEQAAQLDIEQADESISLTDGAPRIRNRILEHMPSIDAMLLDFYHFNEHVWDTAKCCPPDPQEAKAWAQARLAEVKEVGPLAVLAAIAELNKKIRSACQRESLRLLRAYISERIEMLDYRRALARGWDIGSGRPKPCART